MSDYTPKNLDLQLLDLLRQGYTTMSELMDITALGGETVNHAIEALDENRYIERDGFRGANFWSFNITEKGLAALPAMDETQNALFSLGLWPQDIKTLQMFQSTGAVIASEYIYDNIPEREQQREAAASMTKLLRKGYLREFGFMRRKVEVNDKGSRLLNEWSGKISA